MSQTKTLLKLRAKQGYRYLDEIGFGILLIALFIMTGVLFNMLGNVLKASAYGALAITTIFLLSIEFKRNDRFFLKSLFQSNRELFVYKFIESSLIISPIVIFQAYFQRLDIIGGIFIITALVSFLSLYFVKPTQKDQKMTLQFLPLSLFEVKFYFEKKPFTIAIIVILLALGSVHISLWILGIVLLCTMPIEIFSFQESREMLKYEPNFVRKKIIKYLGFFLILVLIPSAITLAMNVNNAIILLYGILALTISIVLVLSKKYDGYSGVVEKVPSQTSTAILTFLMLAPGGILITLGAAIYYYFRAEQHMKHIYASN